MITNLLTLASLFGIALLNATCTNDDNYSSNCVKGKIAGNYCGDIVIEILDDSKIGRDWIGFDSKNYKNSVLATTDSTPVFPSGFKIPTDSIVYFTYEEGNFGRKQYVLCEPNAFVLVKTISNHPCVDLKP